MSIRPGDEKQRDIMPEGGPVMATIAPKPRDLGDNFMVRRALPAVEKRMVGPFIFWDEFGPTRFEAGKGLDVRPHPHINLATVTYLFEGELFHRDRRTLRARPSHRLPPRRPHHCQCPHAGALHAARRRRAR